MGERSWACQHCRLNEVCTAKSTPEDRLESLVESLVDEVLESLFPAARQAPMIPVGVSARHLHIRQEDLETLFGTGYQLTRQRELGQPGEFAANETVAVVGPKRRLFEQVRILGPIRSFTQVELAYSDGVHLGLDLPYRLSGNIKGSAPLVLIGPRGVLNLPEGAIRAARHMHLSPEHAGRMGVKNGQTVSVRTPGAMSVVFNNVVVRVGKDLNLIMHIDTDEANAAGLRCGDKVELLSQEPGRGRNAAGSGPG